MSTSDSRETPDLQETRVYRTDGFFAAHVPFALFLGLLGLVPLAFSEGVKPVHLFASAVLIVTAAAWLAYVLYRRAHPSKPRLELSPNGILFRIPGAKEVRIPWREVSGVEAASGSIFYPSLVLPRFFRYRDVPAVRFSRRYYDRHVHMEPAFLRGPGWRHTFHRDDQWAKLLLHPETLDVSAETLRDAVEARWRAFGSPPDGRYEMAAAPPTPSVARRPSRTLATPVGALSLSSLWYATKIMIMVGGIAALLTNILGVWQTEAQGEARAKDDAWQAQQKKWDDEQRKLQEHMDKQDKEWEEFWRKNQF